MLGEVNMENKIAHVPLSREKTHLFSFCLNREGKSNFKEVENFKECQKDFSIYQCSLAYTLCVFIQMLRVGIMRLNDN